MVAAGVALLLTASGKLREFEYLEREPIETDNGAREQALSMQREMASFCTRQNTIGVVLCILSVLPLFALMCVPGFRMGITASRSARCCFWSALRACFWCARAPCAARSISYWNRATTHARIKRKAASSARSAQHTGWWLRRRSCFTRLVRKGNGQPQYSWFIWAIAGVLYGALMAALSVYRKKVEIRNRTKAGEQRSPAFISSAYF